MANGPQRARLDQVLDTADAVKVTDAGDEWRRCAALLGEVATALSATAALDVRGNTGESMKGAFNRSAEAVQKKIERLEEGYRALTAANTAITTAKSERTALDSDQPGMSEPGAFRPDPEKTPEENQTARGLHQGAVNDYWDRYAKREAEAKRIADALDTRYAESVEVMKRIHGEPDIIDEPPREPRTARTTAPVSPRTTVRPPDPVEPPGPVDLPGPVDPPGPNDPPGPVDPPGSIDPPGPFDPFDPFDPLDPSDPDSLPEQVGTGGGLGTGGLVAGGLLGGGLAAGLTNAIRGGLAAPGQAVRPGSVRPIGSTSRAAVSGALGRAGAMGAGSPVTNRGTGGRSGGGRGAAGRAVGAPAQSGRSAGAGAGTRGASSRSAGGARGSGGAGAAAGGRRGRGKDEEERRSDRDLFDDGQDWVDDEDAASPVLD